MIDWLTSPLRPLRRYRHPAALDIVVLRPASETLEGSVAPRHSVQQSSEPRVIPALRPDCATRNLAIPIDLQPEAGLNRSEISAFAGILREAIA